MRPSKDSVSIPLYRFPPLCRQSPSTNVQWRDQPSSP
jgi:hypothetical protein